MAFDYAAKIQALLAHAEDEGNSEEARATYRAKAEELMREYQIAEEELLAEDPTAAAPITASMMASDYYSEFQYSYMDMFRAVANHTGVRVHFKGEKGADGKYVINAKVVGYEGDVHYTEFPWTGVRLMFITRVDVRVNPELSDQLNAYFMRSSGLSRAQVATALWGSSPKDGVAHGKVQRLYLAECTARGEEPRVQGRGVNAKTYREVYARSFAEALRRRLREARDAVDNIKGGLVLHGRSERVDEAFYTLFPQYRPVPPEERLPAQPCEKCKTTKHDSGKCKMHRPRAWTQADEARWVRMNESAAAEAGRAAGRRAADGVQIQRGGTRAQRVEEPMTARKFLGS